MQLLLNNYDLYNEATESMLFQVIDFEYGTEHIKQFKDNFLCMIGLLDGPRTAKLFLVEKFCDNADYFIKGTVDRLFKNSMPALENECEDSRYIGEHLINKKHHSLLEHSFSLPVYAIIKKIDGEPIPLSQLKTFSFLDDAMDLTRNLFSSVRANVFDTTRYRNSDAEVVCNDSYLAKTLMLREIVKSNKLHEDEEINQILSDDNLSKEEVDLIIRTATTLLIKTGNCGEYSIIALYQILKKALEGEIEISSFFINVCDEHQFLIVHLKDGTEVVCDPYFLGPPVYKEDSRGVKEIYDKSNHKKTFSFISMKDKGGIIFYKINKLHDVLSSKKIFGEDTLKEYIEANYKNTSEIEMNIDPGQYLGYSFTEKIKKRILEAYEQYK